MLKKSICFICGSLEPGKDGVGDYTRRLAGELIRQGNFVNIISVNDKYTDFLIEEYQNDGFQSIKVLRIPENFKWSKKSKIVNDFFNDKYFDFISLQYVPYSFNRKGIAYKFNKLISEIKFKGGFHIMFHELCLGITSTKLKDKVIGFLQFKIINNLVKVTKAKKITTSNILYQNFLIEKGISAKKIQLFSNIPLSTFEIKNENPDKFILGIFGTLYDFSRIDDMLQSIIGNKSDKNFFLVGFGRISNINLWNNLAQKWKNQVVFINKGELPVDMISAQMQEVDLALSCTPMEYLGKSGVYAAWKLHRVPVMALPSKKINTDIDIYYQEYNRMEDLDWDLWDVNSVAKFFLRILDGNN